MMHSEKCCRSVGTEVCGNPASKFLEVNGRHIESTCKPIVAYCKFHDQMFHCGLDKEISYEEYIILKVMKS
jgi:hypothetical protein